MQVRGRNFPSSHFTRASVLSGAMFVDGCRLRWIMKASFITMRVNRSSVQKPPLEATASDDTLKETRLANRSSASSHFPAEWSAQNRY